MDQPRFERLREELFVRMSREFTPEDGPPLSDEERLAVLHAGAAFLASAYVAIHGLPVATTWPLAAELLETLGRFRGESAESN